MPPAFTLAPESIMEPAVDYRAHYRIALLFALVQSLLFAAYVFSTAGA